jgi:two-component system response regulator HydG/two-component system response regulator AtoC
MAALIVARWPGNIRQLIHELERAVVGCDELEIDLQHLSEEFRVAQVDGSLSFLGLRRRVLDAWERDELLRGLERTSWNAAALAEELGLSKRALFARVAHFGLLRPAT